MASGLKEYDIVKIALVFGFKMFYEIMEMIEDWYRN